MYLGSARATPSRAVVSVTHVTANHVQNFKFPAGLYLISLCSALQSADFSFGVASRLGTQSATFNVDTIKLIHSIVTFSPAPESVAIEEFQKVWGIQHLVEPVILLCSTLEPQQWVQDILAFLLDREKSELDEELKPLRDLATEYLNHLLIAARNPGGKKTPQESTHPTPDIVRLCSIQELLRDATISRKQSALKELVYRRDGYRCLLTGLSFRPPGRFVGSRCAHLLPFSFHDKPLTLRALEAFSGRAITAEVVRANINHPSNAFNVENNAHESFDHLAWGIEAKQQPEGQWKYIFREIRDSAATIRLRDGDEIAFCSANDGIWIDPPNPSFCNLKLALARVMHASGASDLIAELYGDDDDDEAIVNQPVYLGGPFVSDDILFRRLNDRLDGG